MKPQPTSATKLRQLGKPLGATFLGIAVLILIIGGRRYFESQVCSKEALACQMLSHRPIPRSILALGFGFSPIPVQKGILEADTTTLVLDHPREIPSKQRQHLLSHYHLRHPNHLQHGHCVRNQSDHLRKIGPYTRMMLSFLDL